MTPGASQMGNGDGQAGQRLNALLVQAGLPELDQQLIDRFEAYFALLARWNARINLTAIRDREGILSRHFVESIACARAVPPGVKTLLDVGSGGGFPGVPIALCRPEVSVVLAESQTRKAAFLQEAVRTLGLSATVYPGRAETLNALFDCVTMRAVDQMQMMVSKAAHLIAPRGWLVLLTTRAEFPLLEAAVSGVFNWQPEIRMPLGSDRVVAIGQNIETKLDLAAQALEGE
jgi:16S rRNA (guanine527-N7)-methyltransferase